MTAYRALAVAIGVLAGCDKDAPGVDAARLDVDPAPYYDVCDPVAPTPCPEPYACVEATAGHEEDTICLVPCDDDGDCPTGYFCNGVEQNADVGAWDHCAEEV